MRHGRIMTKTAALFLSSMMVMSPLTAFAADPSDPVIDNGSNQGSGDEAEKDANQRATNWATNGDIFGDEGGTIQMGTVEGTENKNWFLDFETDDTATEKDAKGNVTVAYFKKTITLKNIKNDDYIPSVPDVEFTYVIEANDYKTAADGVVPAADQIASYNGALMFAGIEGGIKTTETEVVFHHDDKADGDVSANKYPGRNDSDKNAMSKLVKFELDPAKFQGEDPGVYRYLVVETDEKNIDGVTAGTPQDILDDVTKIEDKYRGRILDVVIEKVNPQPTDLERRIVGIAMHECELKVTRDGSGGISWEVVDVNGKTKVEGYTPYSFNEESETKEGPKEAHSRYYTYDFVIGKELTGRGLSKADNSVDFTFNVKIQAPQGADIAGVSAKSVKDVTDDVSIKPEKDLIWTIGTDGTKTADVTVRGTWHFELSGLPGGSIVTVTETTTEGYEQYHNETTIAGLKEDGKLISNPAADSDEEVEFTATVVENAKIKGATAELTVANYMTQSGDDETAAAAKDIQNAFIVNEKNPITVTGVVMNVAPYALMVIAAAVFAGLFISKRRQEEEI